MQEDKTTFYAKWTLIIGLILIFVLPISLPYLEIDKKIGDYSSLSSTFSGITAPFLRLLGSVLIFLALRAQLNMNKIVRNKMEEDTKQAIVRHDLEQIHELYALFQKNIKNFSYENQKSEILITYGKRGIKLFFKDIENLNVEIHNEEDMLKVDGIREILSIINSAKLILQKNANSSLKLEDKKFYRTLIYHELIFSIFPANEVVNDDPIRLKKCTTCEVYHSNFPLIVFEKIQDLKMSLGEN